MKQKNRNTPRFTRQDVSFLFLLVCITPESLHQNAQPGHAPRVGREDRATDTRPAASGQQRALHIGPSPGPGAVGPVLGSQRSPTEGASAQ